MKYARVHKGLVVEICVPIEGFTIEECFHVSLVDQMVACSDDVQPGWVYVDGIFTAPAVDEPAPVESTPPEGQA